METVFTVDGHCDTMLRVMNDPEFDFLARNSDGHLDLPRLKKGGVNLQIMALFVEKRFKPFQALPRTLEMAGALHRLLDQCREDVTLIEKTQDLEEVGRDSKPQGFLMALEGGEALCSSDVLYSFFKLGLRLVTLTWNQRNQLADGVGESCTGGGLTKLGRELVEEMNNLGIGVDVSHLSEKSFWDVAEVSRKPLIASHSNAYAICDHQRNLKDDQISAIVESQGIIGINFCSFFLNKTRQTSIEDILRHIDYLGEGWGFDCIGLGTDFDGIGYPPTDLQDISRLPELFKKLKECYGEEVAVKIMGENWRRVLNAVLPSS